MRFATKVKGIFTKDNNNNDDEETKEVKSQHVSIHDKAKSEL